MTENPDDTLLGDDVEEHDFNFDNEKEEALLADNEFDSFIEEHPKEKSLDPNDAAEVEHLDQEDDVLDIGIAEEDIVENELVSVPSTLDESINFIQEKENVSDENSVPVTETTEDENFESKQFSNVTVTGNEDVSKSELPSRTPVENTLSGDNKQIPLEKNEETVAKPTVISLKKHDKKTYDDLPDLAKVIELVQPHGLSRNRKHNRTAQSFVKKNRTSDVTKVNKHDSNERKDDTCDYHFHRVGKDDSRLNDESKRSYSNDTRCDTSMKIVNRSQHVTEVHSSHNFVSEYKNFSSQSILPRSDFHVKQPIVATVQITQERYQIAGDFPIMRPSVENACQPLIRPFEHNRLFQPGGTLPPPASISHQLSRPPSQFVNNTFQGVRPLIPSSNPNNYNRSTMLSPRVPQPIPRRPIFPSSNQSLLAQPMRQRLPVREGPSVQHNLVPPFISSGGPPPPTYRHDYVQTRSQFGLNSTPPFPQNFNRPPPFSQPPPNINSVNGGFYSETMPHMHSSSAPVPNSMYLNRPPLPTHSLGHFPRMQNDGSHSVMFQQSSQRVIRMPPLSGNVNDGHQCIMNNASNIGLPSLGDYYVKESITTTSSAYLPSSVSSQPPPPGVHSYQSSPTVHYNCNEDHSRNDQVDYNRFTGNEYYCNQPSDKFSHHSKNSHPFRNETMPHDPDTASHYLKRNFSSSTDDDVSTKRHRYSHSDTKSKQDSDDDESEYRKKVEHQKKMRERFVQMKEEQRLKNQMQNFIQNNIKGVLQRREQLLRKNEPESNSSSRFVDVKTKDDNYRSEEVNRNRSSVGKINDKTTARISPTRKQLDKNPLNDTRNSCPSDDFRASPSVIQRLQISDACKTKENTLRVKSEDEKNDFRNATKQLHKVVKIKYKDGTVALKSFPVTGPTKKNIPSIENSSLSDSLNVTIHDDDKTNFNRRRMVISKQTSSSGENNDANLRNENSIVESVRKGVTQSSLSLAQRFSNLKSVQKNENDEDSLVSRGMKSTNRLVVSHEEKIRTVLIKNINSNTKTSLIQKIAGTCGTVTRMKWIPGNGQYNEAKITFSKVEEAKKFIHNYHRKTLDTSLISVTSMISDNK